MKSTVWLQATEVDGDEWTEAGITIERDGGDPEFMDQDIYLTRAEFAGLYDAMKLYVEQGVWSFRTVGE